MQAVGRDKRTFMGLIRSWLVRPLVFLFQWFGIKPSTSLTYSSNSLSIFVKINDGQETITIPVNLSRDWNIKQVKDHLAIVLGKTASGFKIILAGKELHDNVNVRDCDLGPQTIIHAIRIVYSPDDTNSTSRSLEPAPSEQPMNAALLDLQLTAEEQQEAANATLNTADDEESSSPRRRPRAHFYVYCDANSCRQQVPQPGKLRVRCSVCLEGAAVVFNDPCSWDDVLWPGRIQGLCQNSSCASQLSPNDDSGSVGVVDVEFYFKCHGRLHVADKDPGGVGEVPPLELVRPNIRQVPCLSCGDTTSDEDPVVVFDCGDHHVICLDCFKLYCQSRLNERQFLLDETLGYTLGCAVGCQGSLIRQLKHFKVLGSHDYDRYQRFATEESILHSGGVLCPQPGCGMGIITDYRRVACSNCHFVFCKLCLQGFHIGDCLTEQSESLTETRFETDPQRAARARWVDTLDPTSLVAIRLTTKPCPKCRTPTERSGGCMHMICTKAGCGFQWCWVCQTEWMRDCMANHWFG